MCLKKKGFNERIDHRSYKEQGIDREPMVHLGYEAAALERKGIKTERGNHNCEVQKRNAERAAQKVAHKEEIAEKPDVQCKIEKLSQIEEELRKMREFQKTAQYMEKHVEPEQPYVSALEKQLKAEKAMQYIEKLQVQQNNAEQIAKRMTALKENFRA